MNSHELHSPGRLRRRTAIVSTAAALVLVGGGTALGGAAAGWWSDSPSPKRAPAIAAAVADLEPAPLPERNGARRGLPDLSKGQSVASIGDVELIALRTAPDGYCIGPSTATNAYLGSICTDGTTGVSADLEPIFSTWAVARGEAPVWYLAGRVVDAAASNLVVGDAKVALTDGGFFFTTIAQDQWDVLNRADVPVTAVDKQGKPIGQFCATLGYSPTHLPREGSDLALGGEVRTGTCE